MTSPTPVDTNVGLGDAMKKIVLANANLIDPHLDVRNGGRGAVVVVDGRIDSIVSGAEVPPSAAAGERVFDLGGRSIMPGMFTCHFHASYPGLPLAAKQLPIGMESSPSLQVLQAARNARLALDCGYTGIVSAGAPFAIDAALKAAFDSGLMAGPRVMAGSRDISTTGHSLDAFFPWYWEGAVPPSVVNCDGPDAFRRAVREEIKRGSEIIKVFATSGHGVPGVLGKVDLDRAEFAAITEAARQRDVKVRAHVANREGIALALDVGVDLIDHGDGLDDALIDRMAAAGTWFAPSMLFPHRAAQVRKGPVVDAMKAELEAMLEMLPKANAAGVRIVLGDDYGSSVLQHGEYGDELDYYVNVVGISARDVLRWATRNGAELMGNGSECGRLSAGAIADLLIVDGDPLSDIRLLNDASKLLAIMKGGEFVRNQLPALDMSSAAAA